MRYMFALAALLGTTAAALAQTMPAQEFNRWVVWMDREQVGPDWAAVHRAQLLAATHNAGLFQRKEGGAFTAQDFARADPWGEVPVLTPEEQQARLNADYQALLQQMGA